MTDLCLDHIAAANAAVPRNISTIFICFALRKFITRFAHKHFILIIITLNSHVRKIIGQNYRFYRGREIRILHLSSCNPYNRLILLELQLSWLLLLRPMVELVVLDNEMIFLLLMIFHQTSHQSLLQCLGSHCNTILKHTFFHVPNRFNLDLTRTGSKSEPRKINGHFRWLEI